MKSWYSFKNKSADVVDISIHDEIGLWGVTAADFMRELDQHKDVRSINLSVHSPGGSLLDGLAMYNKLKSHPAQVFAKVEGVAASAASFVLMAADHIAMPDNAFIMIHNAWGVGVGDAYELRDIADTMEKMQDSVISIYEKRTGLPREEIGEMMQAATWLTAEDAVNKGFADTINESVDIAAKAAPFAKYFKSMPICQETDPAEIGNVREFEKFLRESGLSKGLATALVSRAKDIFKGEPEEPDAEMAALLNRLDAFKI